MDSSNPFLALFNPTATKVDSGSSDNFDSASEVTENKHGLTDHCAKEKVELSYCIERVFLVTLDNESDEPDPRRPGKCVFLQELFSSLGNQEWLDLENMAQAMFERTLMTKTQLRDAVKTFRKKEDISDSMLLETEALCYLYHCFLRASAEKSKVNADHCKSIIVECSSTCLQQPDLYEGQNIFEQLFSIFFGEHFSKDSELMLEYLEAVFNKICQSESFQIMFNVLQPILKKLHSYFTNGLAGKICSSAEASSGLKMLLFFTRNENLANVLIKYNMEAFTSYEKTLFGTILSSSCLPKNYQAELDLFNNPARMNRTDLDRAEAIIYSNSECITSCVYEIFIALSRLSATTRKGLLAWIGTLLNANYGRVKLAATMSFMGPVMSDDCSDGLMINLSSVLLKLCEPFSQPGCNKLLKIQPIFCRDKVASPDERMQKDLFGYGLPEQTFLIPLEQEDINSIPRPEQYGFITNLFFLTHLSLHLGVHGTYEKFKNLNRELGRLEQMYHNQQNSGGSNTEALKFMFENALKKYFGMKAALTDPVLLKPVLKFHVATASYLTYLATGGDNSTPFSSLTYPFSASNEKALGCLPEFLMTNIIDIMSIARRFKDSFLQEVLEFSGQVMDLILVFMGSKERVKSPHLRAELAEVLHELMPIENDNSMRLQTFEMVKARLFTHHPNIEHLSETLFKVFVSIEATGESVAFEQKLNYRQPMYKVIDYIWKIDIHREAIVSLCENAMKELDSTDPPLFLKFANLLVNDAHFLLDEALDYMTKIKSKEEERVAWQTPLQGAELQQFEANLAHMTMLARFHNMASIDTCHTLALLTSNCSSLFCHNIMLERIVAMLNYFLLKLTGPQMKLYKVAGFEKYEFKPSQVVTEICQIYLNLAHSDEFCQAVAADGRSFSVDLLPRAHRILMKINRPPDIIQSFSELISKIMAASKKQLEDEDLVSSAPEEFIDPLTSCLMKEPVTLPSSGIVIDKATIARHLLSDQTDPYNRSPLTLDQVIPNHELKAKIEDWIKSKRQH